MYRLERIFVWIMRMHCCRGFGIQSPTDYSFVCNVVNEHYPYDSYSDLRKLFPDISWKVRKLCCLYFRISNFLQPDIVAGIFADKVYNAYLYAGCNKAVILDNSEFGAIDSRDVKGLFIAPISDTAFPLFFAKVLETAGEQSILVVEGIHCSSEAKKHWRAIQSDERIGVTFDLYYAGIAFFDKKRYKQNYKINF